MRTLLAAALGVLAAAAAAVVLFAGADLGFADNGDGQRFTCRLGIEPTRSLQHVSAWFEHRPASAGVREWCALPGTQAPSSWALLLRPVVAVATALTGGYDLRWTGVLVCLLTGSLSAAAVLAWRARALPAALLTAPLVLVACDTTFLAYASAPYADPGAFLALTAFVVLLLRAAGREAARGRDLLALGAVGAVLVSVKAQVVTLAAVVVAVLLVELWRGRRVPARGRGAAGAAAAVAVVAAAGAVLAGQGGDYWRTNQYNLLFATVLHDSPDPAATLRELGLDPALARWAGTQIWDPVNALAAPGYPRAHAEFGRADLLAHYVRHPSLVSPLLAEAARQLADPHVTRQADTVVPEEERVGAPAPGRGRAVHGDGAGAAVLSVVGPAGWPGFVLLWVLGAAAGAWLWLRARAAALRQWGAALAVCAASGAVLAATAVLGDGYAEIRKHLVHAAYATALELALLAGGAVVAALHLRARRGAVRAAADAGGG